jgi:hypothetical protein
VEGDIQSAAELPLLLYSRTTFPWRDPLHPFVQRVIPSSDGAVVCSTAAGALHTLVCNHVVQHRVIFPGAGYLEVARAAGATALRAVYFLRPLAAGAPGLLIECAVSDERFEVRSSETAAFEDATVHCSGATATDTICWQSVEHASLRTLSRAADVAALYDGFDAVGLQYGPGYRTLTNAWAGASDAFARLRARPTHEGTQVHPAHLDDALCTSAAMASSGGGGTRLPFAVDDALLQGAPGELWAVKHGYGFRPAAKFPVRPKPVRPEANSARSAPCVSRRWQVDGAGGGSASQHASHLHAGCHDAPHQPDARSALGSQVLGFAPANPHTHEGRAATTATADDVYNERALRARSARATSVAERMAASGRQPLFSSTMVAPPPTAPVSSLERTQAHPAHLDESELIATAQRTTVERVSSCAPLLG